MAGPRVGINGGRALALAFFVAQICRLIAGESDDPMSEAFEPIDDPAFVALLQVGMRLPMSEQARSSANESVLLHTSISGNATQDPDLKSLMLKKSVQAYMEGTGLPFRFETGEYTVSSVHAWCLVACYLSYSVVCLWYELRCAAPVGADQPGQEKPCKHRDGKMDFIRLAMHLVIIAEHVSVALQVSGKDDPLLEMMPGMNTASMPYVSTHYKMCIFAILSGIFGASVDFDHLTNVLCYTLGAILFVDVIIGPTLACLTVGELRYSAFSPPAMKGNFPDVKWYLWSLLIWRFAVSPLFAVARNLRLSALVPFALTLGLSFVLPNCIPYGTFHRSPPFLDYTFALAPFFAMGLLRPAKWWFAALESQTWTRIAVLICVMWYSCIILFPTSTFSEWAQSDIRLTNFRSTGLTWGNILHLSSLTLSKVGISFAAMWVLAAVHDQFQRAVPRRFMDVLVGCGSRTLNGYVLHMYVTCYVFVACMMKHAKPITNPSTFVLVTFIISVHACFTWCCKLTDKLVGWMLMPYWIKRLAKHLVDLTCPAFGRPMPDGKEALGVEHSKETSYPAPAGEMLNAQSGESNQ
mmetsp:Transcript_71992/g.154009  ORF Transcript_71992/g.154009 Transcript_71992/m.154009 type:complete len:580 (+) Transcript_71992:49-1788(+)